MTPVFGWIPPSERDVETQRSHESIVSSWPEFQLIGTAERKRLVFWDHEKALLGKWLPNQAQQIGDCVSWGAKHVVDRLAIFEIAQLGQWEKFRPSFAPYFYGISRVQIGGGRIRGDGSLGSWAAEGVMKYGVLAADEPGVPEYSGSVARKWGSSGPPDEFVSIARKNLVKEAVRLKNADQAADAICGGFPITIAGSRGYSMRLKDRAGKSWFVGRDTWNHQMWLAGFDTDPEPCFYRGNNWGPDAHGPQLDGPPGGGWITMEELDKEMRSSDSEVYSFTHLDGFKAFDWSVL